MAATGPENQDEAQFRLPGIPEVRPLGLTWEERLDEWRELVRTPTFSELPHVRAGAEGELSMRRFLGRHESSRFGELFGGKRVPRVVGNPAAGRYEMDLIVVTPRRIVAFEAKHWSGRLRRDGDQWVYERRSGEVQVFQDLVEYNAEKLTCLRRHLSSEGVDLPAGRFEQHLVFTHPRVELDAGLRDHPRIVTISELVGSTRRLGAATTATSYLLAALIERCASQTASAKLTDGLFDILPPRLTAAAAAVIAHLRTWDVLRLHGGRELIGDLVWLRFDGERIDGAGLPSGGVASLRWRRQRIASLLPLAGIGPFGRIKGKLISPRSLRVHDCVYFHEAGHVKPAVISLASVDEIRMG